MRIGINLLAVRHSIGGAYNYIENLISSISLYDEDNEYFVFVTRFSQPMIKSSTRIKIIKCSIDSRNRFIRVIYENTVLQFFAKIKKLDRMLWPLDTIGFINVVPSIVICHDFLGLIKPKSFSKIKRNYLKLALNNTLKNADVILPISNSTASELKKLTKRNLSDLKVLPNILDLKFSRAQDEEIESFRKKYKLPDKFWLYVAHYYPHKNHSNLLLAYSKLLATNPNSHKLVLRGDRVQQNIVIKNIIEQNNLESRVLFLPKLESAELPFLYSSATALVFPSLYEGGGIPIMEAMACGCPVVASRIPTTLEFAGKAALLFDPYSIESIKNAMEEFQNNESIRERLTENGYSCAEKLRPNKIISTLKGAYL